MSILYCSIPHFAVTLARRDDASLQNHPLVLVGPDRRIFDASAEAAAFGVTVGLPVRTAEVRCPQARLLEADVAHCRTEFELLLELLDLTSPKVEPHGWGAAYVDLGDLASNHTDALALCKEIGQAVRRELGKPLQPALGWDSAKFTAQAAAQRTQPGHLLAVAAVRARAFLNPLPVTLLPLEKDPLRRLGFLGLRTLGQYAALPSAAVWQQFGRAGKLALRCARGEDDRPVVPRSQERRLTANRELDNPLAEQERLLALLRHLISPLLAKLRGNLRVCGLLRLTVEFADRSTQERELAFLFATSEETRVMLVLGQLLAQMHWSAGAISLKVTLERIQDVTANQLALFSGEPELQQKLHDVQRNLASRFGADRLRRAVLVQPGAPLPEWRVGWLAGQEP